MAKGTNNATGDNMNTSAYSDPARQGELAAAIDNMDPDSNAHEPTDLPTDEQIAARIVHMEAWAARFFPEDFPHLSK